MHGQQNIKFSPDGLHRLPFHVHPGSFLGQNGRG